MGQQQLLLFILITIIVGIATLVAFDGIDETHVEAGKDAIQQDIILALADAQTYYYKPSNMGGGGQSFQNITFNDLSLEPSTPNGEYTLTSDKRSLTLIGVDPSINVRIEAKAQIDAEGSMHITWKY